MTSQYPGEPVEPAKPTVSLTTAPAAANGRASWFTSPVTVSLAGAVRHRDAARRNP